MNKTQRVICAVLVILIVSVAVVHLTFPDFFASKIQTSASDQWNFLGMKDVDIYKGYSEGNTWCWEYKLELGASIAIIFISFIYIYVNFAKPK